MKERIGQWKQNSDVFLSAFSILKGVLYGVMVAWLFYQSPYGLLLLPFSASFFFLCGKREKKEKERQKEQQQFLQYLGFLREAMNAGYSLERAVQVARKELLTTCPETDNFPEALYRMQQKLSLGMPVEQGFTLLAGECSFEEAADFSEVLLLAKRTGGTVTEVIKNTDQVLRSKQETMQYIEKVLHGRLYETKIMKSIPFLMLLYLKLCLPGFLSPLYHNAFGVILMTILLLLHTLLCFLIDKITGKVRL